MIRVLLVTLSLVISPSLADNTQNELAPFVLWRVGENMVPRSENPYVWATKTAIFENHAFLAFPRSKTTDVPVTLARMSLEEGNEHKQYPFPDLGMQEKGNCTALQDVIDIFIDSKGLLWVLDIGYFFPRRIRKSCEPKIVAFNVTTEKVVNAIELPHHSERTDLSPLFRHIVVDYNKEGHPFVYASDIQNRKIFVFNKQANTCINSVQLPNNGARNPYSNDITINLVRNGTSGRVVINDEKQEESYYLETEDVRACTGAWKGVLHESAKPKSKVVLGNDDKSTVYYREKIYDGVIHKYDALDDTVPDSVAYDGNVNIFPTHVVPDYKRGGMRLLQSYYSEFEKQVKHSLELMI